MITGTWSWAARMLACAGLSLLLWACETPPAGRSLVDSAFHLHPIVEPHMIDVGTPEARPFLVEGFTTVDEVWNQRDTFVWSKSQRVVIEVPVWFPRATPLRARVRPMTPMVSGGEALFLEARVGATSLGRQALGEGFVELTWMVPAAAWRQGRNRIVFEVFRGPAAAPDRAAPEETGLAWDWILFGDMGAEAHPLVRPAEGDRPARLDLPPLTAVDIVVEKTGPLALSFGRLEAAGSTVYWDNTDLVVEVEGSADRGPRTYAWRASTAAEGAALPLEDVMGEYVRLRWRAQPRSLDLTPWPLLYVIDPRLAGARPIEVVAPAPAPPPGPPPWLKEGSSPPLLIYLIDTLRRDRLGVYGYGRPTSPNIDAFARDAVVFDEAYGHSSWTRPTVASLLTGRYPVSHGAVEQDLALPDDVTTLAEHLEKGGYVTGTVSTNSNDSPLTNFDQGVDWFQYLPEGIPLHVSQLSDEVNRVALPWLRQRAVADMPWYLLLHTTDPHGPYTPKQPFLRRFAGLEKLPALHDPLLVTQMVDRGDLRLTDGVLRRLSDLYDAEVAFNDEQFGRLMASLKEMGLYEGAMIVVVADHGEEFGEHGGLGHSKTLYGEQLRIPLIIKFPGNWRRGVRYEGRVEQVDLLPTVLAALGRPQPAGLEGRNLLGPIATGQQPPGDVPLHASLEANDRVFRSITLGQEKMILGEPFGLRGETVELYDLAVDPGEADNRATGDGRRQVIRDVLRSALAAFRARFETTRDRDLDRLDDENLRRRLRAMGYLQ